MILWFVNRHCGTKCKVLYDYSFIKLANKFATVLEWISTPIFWHTAIRICVAFVYNFILTTVISFETANQWAFLYRTRLAIHKKLQWFFLGPKSVVNPLLFTIAEDGWIEEWVSVAGSVGICILYIFYILSIITISTFTLLNKFYPHFEEHLYNVLPE